MKSLLTPARHSLLTLACVGLALRAFIPVGFMASPLSEGWPTTLCPAQGAEFFSSGQNGGHVAHHDGENDGTEVAREKSSCPLGAYFSAVVDSDSAGTDFRSIESRQRIGRESSSNTLWRPGSISARGPPSLLLPTNS